MTEKLQIIQKALTDALGREVEISPETHLVEDEVLDSLDSAVFLLNVETETGVTLSEDVVAEKDLFKVANLLDFVSGKQVA